MKLIFATASRRRYSRSKVGWAAAIPAIANLAGNLFNKGAANKNSSIATNLQYQPIDLQKLQADAQDAAAKNAANSLALEAKLQPDLAATRSGLSSAISSDLSRAGSLPTDVVNEVTRGSVAGANTAGLFGGGGPLTAASLGLTSLALRNQAEQKAAGLLAANPLPASGLDPGALASAAIGQNNALNQFNLYKSGVMTNANQSQANANNGLFGALGTLGSAFLKGSGGGGGGSSGIFDTVVG